MLVRFRSDVINHNPETVVILAGTNDIAMNQGYVSLDHIFENIVSMAELATCNGIKVMLCSVLPAYRQEVVMVRSESMDKEVPVIYILHGFHPVREGYDIMKGVLLKALKSNVSDKFPSVAK